MSIETEIFNIPRVQSNYLLKKENTFKETAINNLFKKNIYNDNDAKSSSV